MKALTLTHPWPWAFVELPEAEAKRVENRSWEPPHWLIGQYIALHGGKVPTGARLAEAREAALYIHNTILEDETGDPDMIAADLSDNDIRRLCIPGICAVARLARVVTSSDSPWFFGPFGWELEDLIRIDPPVPHIGKQGLWDVQETATCMDFVRERARAARKAASAPVAPPAPTCGTCDHWTPSSPSMGECLLGWEAHDNLRDSRGKPTTAAHGGLLLPEMHAGCSCAATVGGRTGYVARRGEV